MKTPKEKVSFIQLPFDRNVISKHLIFIGCGDALGVDWSSIVEESKRKPKEESECLKSGKQKWQPHHILLETGVSINMASTQFATQVIKTCYEKLKTEVAEDIQSKIEGEHQSTKSQNGVKQEPLDEQKLLPEVLQEKINAKLPYSDTDLLSRPCAFSQVALKRRQEARQQLIENSIGSFSRALSARQDLKIRRRLCGLPEEEIIIDRTQSSAIISSTLVTNAEKIEGEGETADGPPVKQVSSIELAFQMFRKATEKVC